MIRLTDNFNCTLYVPAARIALVETIAGEKYSERITCIHIDGYLHSLQVRETPSEIAALKTAWEERYERLEASHDGIVQAVFIDEDGVVDVEFLKGHGA